MEERGEGVNSGSRIKKRKKGRERERQGEVENWRVRGGKRKWRGGRISRGR